MGELSKTTSDNIKTGTPGEIQNTFKRIAKIHKPTAAPPL